jgi:hypothetical protein
MVLKFCHEGWAGHKVMELISFIDANEAPIIHKNGYINVSAAIKRIAYKNIFFMENFDFIFLLLIPFYLNSKQTFTR